MKYVPIKTLLSVQNSECFNDKSYWNEIPTLLAEMSNSFSPEKLMGDDFVFPAESTATIVVLEVQQSPLWNELNTVNLTVHSKMISSIKYLIVDIFY